MFRKENGVTLVALVITIIVLLILAGVTISMALGDDGIMSNSTEAAKQSEKADIESLVKLASITVRTDVEAKKTGVPTSTARPEFYSAHDRTNIKSALAKFNSTANYTIADVTGTGNEAKFTVTGDYWVATCTVGTSDVTVAFDGK